MTKIKQPLRYHGGKNLLAPWLHFQAPPSVHEDPINGYTHRNYPFAGGLAEFWNWEPVDGISEAVNDINKELSNFWFAIRSAEYFPKLQQLLEGTPFSEEEWKNAVNILPALGYRDRDRIQAAWCFFVKFRQSRQGLGKSYATPTSRTRRGMNENVSAWISAVDGLPECHKRLRRVEIRCLDFREFIPTYDHKGALFYCDPTYLHKDMDETQIRSALDCYSYEMSLQDHIDLLELLSTIEGRFMLSGYQSKLYDWYAKENDWEVQAKRVSLSSSSKKTKEQKTEICWRNY